MAGIGFELKKMFNKKGILSVVKAYGYTGMVVAGPMLLGIMLLLGIRVIAGYAGASQVDIELLNAVVTVTLLGSMLITNVFSMVTTRYVADQLFENKYNKVMASFWGSLFLMLAIGGLLYIAFLFASGIEIRYAVMAFILFGELVVVWTEMNYLTAIKDYRGILKTFAFSIVMAFAIGFMLSALMSDQILVMLIAVVFAYGLMDVLYYHLLISYFPRGKASGLLFLKWFDKYPELAFVGLFSYIGVYGHMIIMWGSPAHVEIRGLFRATPMYDIPALLAFMTTLITTINFVSSVEVNFYPKYRNYFGLFNAGGTYIDIKQAEKEMVQTLIQELTNTFSKQFFSTIILILAGSILLPLVPLGMTSEMLGIYRLLCIGYAFYAVGNCVMLIQLYFADNKGALISTFVFMLVSTVFTFVFREQSTAYYGLGFTLGGLAYTIVSLYLLYKYLRKLLYHVLCGQPIVASVRYSWMSKISDKAKDRYNEKYKVYEIKEEE